MQTALILNPPPHLQHVPNVHHIRIRARLHILPTLRGVIPDLQLFLEGARDSVLYELEEAGCESGGTDGCDYFKAEGEVGERI